MSTNVEGCSISCILQTVIHEKQIKRNIAIRNGKRFFLFLMTMGKPNSILMRSTNNSPNIVFGFSF